MSPYSKESGEANDDYHDVTTDLELSTTGQLFSVKRRALSADASRVRFSQLLAGGASCHLLKAVSVTLLVSWRSFDAGEGYLVTAS